VDFQADHRFVVHENHPDGEIEVDSTMKDGGAVLLGARG